MQVNDDQIERLGQLADRLDAILYSAKMPLPPDIHLHGICGAAREVRDEIASLVVEISGENPWEHNPLEG